MGSQHDCHAVKSLPGPRLQSNLLGFLRRLRPRRQRVSSARGSTRMAARWPSGSDAATDARYGLDSLALFCRDQCLELALFLYDSTRFLDRYHGLPGGSSVAIGESRVAPG